MTTTFDAIIIDAAIRVDMRSVKARKDAISGQARIWIETWLKQMENCSVYQGSKSNAHSPYRFGARTMLGEVHPLAG
jgi:hypothetical protein